jgi:RNA polymerase sigma-70 factor, ECF subfamily
MDPGKPGSQAAGAFEKCRKRYPAVDLPFEDFLARLTASPVPWDQLHLEDLFLAIACGNGNRIAWEHFLDEYHSLLRQWAGQACRQYQVSEDIAQDMLAMLLEDRGKLASYDGRGRLSSWLRVIVSRAAIDRFRRTRRDVSLEEKADQGQEWAIAQPPPEDDDQAIDARWGPVLAASLEAELKSIPAQDRLMLGLYYLHGVPLKKIAQRLGVHEATASRWLDGIRNRLRKAVEKQLRRRHGLRPSEIASLWRRAAEEDRLSLKEILP